MVYIIRSNTGLHYGILACEADKQFLKRTFHEQQLYRKCPLACPPRTRSVAACGTLNQVAVAILLSDPIDT